MKRSHWLCAAVLLAVASSAPALDYPVAVSPGSPEGAVIDSPCPSFSWSAVEGAKGYEMIVYKLSGVGDESRPVLEQRFETPVFSWTPPMDRCFDRGGRYAWVARAHAGRAVSDWSVPSLFLVAPGSSEAAFETALEVVKSYIADKRKGAESVSTAENSDDSNETDHSRTGRAPDTALEPATTQLSVDGNIDASSFTGDGTNLAGVATDAELGNHMGESGAHHPQTVDTFVTNKDAHDHLGGDGATLLHSSLDSVGSSDHHQPFSNPDGPCFDAGKRFVDCSNGTVTDVVTGLIYLKDADCFGQQNWPTANESAANLKNGSCGLTDGSRAGDWRLQTKEEWEGLLAPKCKTDPLIVGNGKISSTSCYSDSSWASNVISSKYWSSTSDSEANTNAWRADLFLASSESDLKSNATHVWPVRDGRTIVGGGRGESWAAHRLANDSGLVWPAGSTPGWTNIPGLSITFNLSRAALVQLHANGSQRSWSSGTCHVGYRYVIDGVGQGEVSWGQRILVSSATDSWWSGWSLGDYHRLAIGEHTIRVQAIVAGSSANCAICAETNGTTPGYTSCILQIMAFHE